MIGSVSDSYSSFYSNTQIIKKPLTAEDFLKQMGARDEDETRVRVELVQPEEQAQPTEAQRYMANNVKALAMASAMIEDAEDDDEDEDGKKKSKATKPGGELANVSMSQSNGGGDSAAGSSETEIVTMPDGSKVMIVKTEMNGVTTMVKVKLSSGKENQSADEVGKTDGSDASGQGAATAAAGAAAPAA